MKTVEIPGGTAEIRDTHDVKVRHRRLIESAGVAAAPIIARLPKDGTEFTETTIADMGLDRHEAELMFELQDATVVALLAGWSLDLPLPTMDTIGDLDTGLYEALGEITRDIGSAVAMGGGFEPSDPKASGFSDTPTLPSDD